MSMEFRQMELGPMANCGEMEITMLHTPGHTEGSQCFLFENRLVSGDTLFIGGCGRVDFPDSDPEKMYRSLRKISELPDQTVIFPGHNYAQAPSASVKTEKISNPYLKTSSTSGLAEFLSLVGR